MEEKKEVFARVAQEGVPLAIYEYLDRVGETLGYHNVAFSVHIALGAGASCIMLEVEVPEVEAPSTAKFLKSHGFERSSEFTLPPRLHHYGEIKRHMSFLKMPQGE